MNHWDRLQAAIRGDATDCLPISFWRHWPEHDQEPRALAKAIASWQRRFDFDLVRFMPSNTCAAEHWGARAVYRPNALGTRTITRLAVTTPAQWAKLPACEVDASALAPQNEGLNAVAQALGGTVPLVQTVASPLTTAWQLAGDAVFEHMTTHPDELEAGLRIIARASAAFARQAIGAGACGVSLVVDCARSDLLTMAQYMRFGQPFDIQVLAAAGDRARINMLHVSGENIMFDVVAAYPVQILNWPDRSTAPDLGTGKTRFAGLVAGGLDAFGELSCGPQSSVDASVGKAIARVDGARALITSGGPCAIDTPEGHIDVAVDAVRRRATHSEVAQA
jgi:uroporphyrinogen decarboxylase